MPLIDVPQSATTELYLCKNVIVDPSYNHVYDFNNAEQQEAYFTNSWTDNPRGKAFYIFNDATGYYSKLTFQRIGQGFRVPINREVLEENGINYLCFRNTRIVNEQQTTKTFTKMYYCFITSLNYINENVTEIYYEVDIYQTYMFDFEIRPCFVEREMVDVTDDVRGKNIISENVGYGDYIQFIIEPTVGGGYIDPRFKNNEWNWVVAATVDRGGNLMVRNDGGEGAFNYFGVLSGLAYLVFSDVDKFKTWLLGTVSTNGLSGIEAVYCVPKIIASTTSTSADTEKSDYDANIPPNGSVSQARKGLCKYPFPLLNGEECIGKYVPVNKKLLNYPYNMLFLTTGNAESKIYKWEYFKTVNEQTMSEAIFGLFGTAITPVEIAMVPYGYNGGGYKESINVENYGYNMWERLTLTDVPICSFNTDVYRAYMAGNKFKIGYEIAASLLGAVPVIGNIAKGTRKKLSSVSTSTVQNVTTKKSAESGRLRTTGKTINTKNAQTENYNIIEPEPDYGIFNGLASIFATLLDKESLPPQAQGATTNILNMATSMAGFNAYQTCIRPEYAKVIDDYFSKFGYACHEVKTPKLNNRRYWNYVKTLDVLIVPKVNQNNNAAALNTRETVALQAIFDSGVTIWHCFKLSDGDLSGEANFGDYSNNNHQA